MSASKGQTGSGGTTGGATAANQTTELAYLQNRYGGGKSVVTATVTNSGDTTLIDPAPGNHLEIYWVYAITDPDQSTVPLVKISLGATEIYRLFAVSHWEKFVGATDETLTINLSEGSSVALTVHYREIT